MTIETMSTFVLLTANTWLINPTWTLTDAQTFFIDSIALEQTRIDMENKISKNMNYSINNLNKDAKKLYLRYKNLYTILGYQRYIQAINGGKEDDKVVVH
jgi:hypothetical protein